MKKIIGIIALSATIFSIFLNGCGGGGGGGPSSPSNPPTSNESASGIWNGYFYSDVTKGTNIVNGICTENNEIRLWSTTTLGQFNGNGSVSGSSITGSLAAFAPPGSVFPDGSVVGTIGFTGTVSTKLSISGTYFGVGDRGTFSLTYDSAYERSSSFALVKGTWFIYSPQLGFVTIFIDSYGQIKGNSLSGCVINGKVEIINASRNIYQVNIGLGSCGLLTGNYNGHAILDDTKNTNDTFIVGVSHPTASLVGFFNNTWMKIWGTNQLDLSHGIAVDSSGNVYVTGYTEGNLDGKTNMGNSDIFLTKFDAIGNKQWTRLEGTSGYENGNGVAVDSSGNVYVTGGTNGNLDGNTNAGNGDIFLIKYDSSGTKLWTRLEGTSSGDGGGAVAVDSSGNVYVTGGTYGNLDGNPNAGDGDILLIKYDPSGSKLWTRLAGTSSGEYGNGVAVDNSGNVYVTGITSGNLDGNSNPGALDVFLMKFDSIGNKKWTRVLGTSRGNYGNGVAVDSSGNVYVTGGTGGDLDGNTNMGNLDIFLTKFDSLGTKQWTRLAGTSDVEYGSGVAVDNSGNVYVTGITYGNLGGNNNSMVSSFLMKYDSSGAKLWTRLWGQKGGFRVVTDNGGNIFVTGGASPTGGDLYDIFLVRFDSNGIPVP